MTTVTITSSGTWVCPAGVTSLDSAEAWGLGGKGADGVAFVNAGGGGGGGGYSKETSVAVTVGNSYTVTIDTTSSRVTFDAVTLTANAGQSPSSYTGGTGGAASGNTVSYAGGKGGNGGRGSAQTGGGGGGGAGPGGAGGAGGTGGGGLPGAGGTSPDGGTGGKGGQDSPEIAPVAGTAPGGAGGGGSTASSQAGASGATGKIVLTYTPSILADASLSGDSAFGASASVTGTLSGTASLSGDGTFTATASLGGGGVINQWAATFAQPSEFGTTPPALQSIILPLTPATQAGPGTGYPSAGNWLFCITGITEQDTSAGATVSVGDDIRSWWRPGDETTSTWAVSTGTALTRTSVWYTANTARQVGQVYIAPSGARNATSVLVIEVDSLGPWDTVTGIYTDYAAAATSLTLALGAPPAQSFFLAAATGDSATAGQSLTPSGWTPLATVNSSNGTDHTCDCVLTTAIINTSSSVSATATASSATDLSGVVIGVQATAASPVPAGHNPDWPYLLFEAAFGSGFQTPPDQLTWTDLSDRLWDWDETTGIQYQLGQIQASNVQLEADNYDNALASDNASGPYAGNILTGVPLRIRAAIGTVGGVSRNRWYVIQRNLQEWPQEIGEDLRRYIAGTATDIWSSLAADGPSPYRGEIEQDKPYAWWPMDDQPLAGGVQPTSLRNAATGNTTAISITPNPSGVASADAYSTSGTDLTATGTTAVRPPLPSIATSAVGQQQGWMYGDPPSSPQSAQSGNPVTANPGSAAWQQSGLLGNTGSETWFLDVNDTSFPGLSSGVTVKGWFQAGFAGSATGYTAPSNSKYVVAAQPVSQITLCTLSTGSAPVAILYLDTSGHLILQTFVGTAGTTHAIYSASDLRNGAWNSADLLLTTTTYRVLVNGGLTADVSGTMSAATSAWTWLTINGDYGTSQGGSSPSSIVHGGNVAYSHWAVFGSRLPAWRLLAHYCAAITGFGLLPAPQAMAITDVGNQLAGQGYVPDGTEYQGSYGGAAFTAPSAYTFSAVAASVAGSYTSGPAARAVHAGYGYDTGGVEYGNAVWAGLTALAPSVVLYTAAAAGSETAAAVICGTGNSFTSGYGSGASGHGVCQTAAGTGASPPSSASPLGDTVAQRIERILGYAALTYPGRCIDPASLPVQAATDIGGQSAGGNITDIAQSDGGLLFIDNLGNLTYWQKSRLAAQYSSPVWTIGPAADGATTIPYAREIRWTADPQRIWNAIQITPFSPDGTTPPLITPSSASSVTSSQKQYGAQPYQITSYLQSTTEMQSQADWLFTEYGQVRIRAEGVKIDAASYPAAWALVLGANIGDVVSLTNWQVGGGGNTGTFRITEIKRHISYGAKGADPEASIELTLDFEPPTRWS